MQGRRSRLQGIPMLMEYGNNFYRHLELQNLMEEMFFIKWCAFMQQWKTDADKFYFNSLYLMNLFSNFAIFGSYELNYFFSTVFKIHYRKNKEERSLSINQLYFGDWNICSTSKLLHITILDQACQIYSKFIASQREIC